MSNPEVGEWECLRRAYNEIFYLTPDKASYIRTPLTETTQNLLVEWFIIQDRYTSQYEINETFDDLDIDDDEEEDEELSHQDSEQGSNNYPLPQPEHHLELNDGGDPLPWIEEYNGDWGYESDIDSTLEFQNPKVVKYTSWCDLKNYFL